MKSPIGLGSWNEALKLAKMVTAGAWFPLTQKRTKKWRAGGAEASLVR